MNYSGGIPEAGLPKWAPVSEGKLPVMYFDNTCVVKNDPESETRKLMAAGCP